jgi:hypothetical protein
MITEGEDDDIERAVARCKADGTVLAYLVDTWLPAVNRYVRQVAWCAHPRAAQGRVRGGTTADDAGWESNWVVHVNSTDEACCSHKQCGRRIALPAIVGQLEVATKKGRRQIKV